MHMADPADGVLLERARRGDATAFEELVRRHARAAFAAARAILGNQADAEDVCQDAWVRALERLEDCRNPDRFVFWFLQVVRNRARNYVRYRSLRATEPLDAVPLPDPPAGAGDPFVAVERRRQRARLEAAIAQVPEAHREVLLLHDLAEWKHKEIAESLRISEVLSRQRLFQARARLRQILRATDGGGA